MGCNPWKISELQKNPEWVQYQTILNAITLKKNSLNLKKVFNLLFLLPKKLDFDFS